MRCGAVPVIPGQRHLIENAFCRLKDFPTRTTPIQYERTRYKERRVATRYDKLAANFLSAVAIATLDAYWL